MSDSQDLQSRARSIIRLESISYDSPDEALQSCLSKVVEAIGAERGFIMIYDSGFDELSVFVTHNLDIDTIFTSAEISQTVVNQLFEERKSILSSNASYDPRFSDKSSVIISGLRSLMCVPIQNEKGLLGLIYLDNRTVAGFYSKEDLELLECCGKEMAAVMEHVLPDLIPKA